MKQEAIYAGIDVAKDRLDVALRPSGTVWSVAYDQTGVSALVSQLQSLHPSAVVLESTGGLELPLAGGPGGGPSDVYQTLGDCDANHRIATKETQPPFVCLCDGRSEPD